MLVSVLSPPLPQHVPSSHTPEKALAHTTCVSWQALGYNHMSCGPVYRKVQQATDWLACQCTSDLEVQEISEEAVAAAAAQRQLQGSSQQPAAEVARCACLMLVSVRVQALMNSS